MRRYFDYEKRVKIRPSIRRMKPEKLLEALRTEITANIARHVEYLAKCDKKYHVHLEDDDSHDCAPNRLFYTAEEVASEYRVKKAMVETCFRKLNQEGLLSQGHNTTPHEDEGSPRTGLWQATLYHVRYPNDCAGPQTHDGRPNRRRK